MGTPRPADNRSARDGPQTGPRSRSTDVLPSGQGDGIYLMNVADGTSLLITDTASGDLISWSPDGKEIAYTRANGDVANVWAVDVANGHLRQITHDGFGYDPAWSPDGTMIAYFHDSAIWTANADGSGHATRVTPDDGHESFNPNWSSDGGWITFYSDQHSGHDDLYRIHPDGTGLTELTDTPQVEQGGAWRPVG
jgi:Tol biopolymer transport system component